MFLLKGPAPSAQSLRSASSVLTPSSWTSDFTAMEFWWVVHTLSCTMVPFYLEPLSGNSEVVGLIARTGNFYWVVPTNSGLKVCIRPWSPSKVVLPLVLLRSSFRGRSCECATEKETGFLAVPRQLQGVLQCIMIHLYTNCMNYRPNQPFQRFSKFNVHSIMCIYRNRNHVAGCVPTATEVNSLHSLWPGHGGWRCHRFVTIVLSVESSMACSHTA